MLIHVTFVKVTISREADRKPSRVGLGWTSQVKCCYPSISSVTFTFFCKPGMVLATKQRTTWSWRCAWPTPTWSRRPSASCPSTSASRTPSGFPSSAARVRATLVKSVSTSQTSSLVLPVKVRIAIPQSCLTCLLLHSTFPSINPFPHLDQTSPPAHHSVFGAFSLEICLRFPSLLPKPACQGQSLKLWSLQGGGNPMF